MSNSTIELIQQISPQKWEQCLDIGKFEGLEVLELLNRRFSKVCRCRVHGKKKKTDVYVKIFQDTVTIDNRGKVEAVRSEYETLYRWSAEFKNSAVYGVVTPLFYDPEKFIIVTKEVSGISLYNILNEKCKFHPDPGIVKQMSANLQKVGGWLQYFHSKTPPEDKLFSIDDLIVYLDRRLILLTTEYGRFFPHRYRKRVLNFLEEKHELITPDQLKLGLTHGDFNLGNIIVGNDKITVLDFGEVKFDSYLLDVARIYHQLYLMTLKPIYRPGTIQRLQGALLNGFGCPHATQLMIFRYLLIRHTITHLVTITRFWLKPPREKLYNFWVMRNELKLLDYLMRP